MLQTDLQLLFIRPCMTTASLISLEESESASKETKTSFRVNVTQFYFHYYNPQINTCSNI